MKNINMSDQIKEGLEDYEEIVAAQEWMNNPDNAKLIQKRRIRAKARAIGLHYWPALYVDHVDPKAFVYAEAVFKDMGYPKYGTMTIRWGEPALAPCGWDVEMFYGVSARTVAQIWLICGCRNNGKFKLLVKLAVNGDLYNYHLQSSQIKSLRVNQLKHWLNGWTAVVGKHNGNPRFGNDYRRLVLIAIGRLSSEYRQLALEGTEPKMRNSSELNWGLVQQHMNAVNAIKDPTRKELLVNALRGETAMGRLINRKPTILDAVLPHWKHLHVSFLVQLVKGVTPVELAGNLLTKKEATQWLADSNGEVMFQEGMMEQWVAEWICVNHDLPEVRSVKVARWLQYLKQNGKWDTVTRKREAIHLGVTHQYTLLDILDEIMEDDIVTGVDGVTKVIERANERKGEEFFNRIKDDHAVIQSTSGNDWLNELPEGIRWLNTPAALAREGREMNHCVGTYVQAVKNNQCYILALRNGSLRSTVELSVGDLTIRQHRGRSNGEVSDEHKKVMDDLLMKVARDETYHIAV